MPLNLQNEGVLNCCSIFVKFVPSTLIKNNWSNVKWTHSLRFCNIRQYLSLWPEIEIDKQRVVWFMQWIHFPVWQLPLFDLPICWWLRFLPKLTLLSGVSSLHLNIAIHSWRLSNNQQFFVVKNMRTKGDFLIALTFKVEDDCQFWMGKQRSFFISTSSVFSSYILTLSLDCDDAAMAQEKLMWGCFGRGNWRVGLLLRKEKQNPWR